MLLALFFLFSSLGAAAQQPAPAAAPASARVWEEKPAEYEAYLRSAQVVKMTSVELGVTHPKRAFFAPGGLVASAAWKPLRPGFQNGYWESYKSEIAAYELDKLLQLGMVPVVVERKIDGLTGALILWLEGVRTWLEVQPLPKPPLWERQLARMKLFDDLIGNPDRNQGNLLVDQAWNLILIDHSRAFTATMQMPFPMRKIDRELYAKLKELDEATLKPRLGKLVMDGAKSILKRRDKIVENFEQLIAQYGEAAVLIP